MNYQTDDTALEFLRMLRASCANSQFEVLTLIVDNSDQSTGDHLFLRARKIDPAVICLKPPSNLGYFGGARFGLEYYQEHIGDIPDWVIVTNVDIMIDDSDFFLKLVNTDRTNHVGVVAPRIWSELRQCEMNPNLVSRPSRLRMLFYRRVFANYYLQWLYLFSSMVKYSTRIGLRHVSGIFNTARRSTPNEHRHEQFIYSPRGAFIAFSKEYFTRGGTLNHPGFLFSEEIFVAETTLELGLRVLYNPGMVVRHVDNEPKSEMRSRKMAQFMAESTAIVIDRYFTKNRS